MTYIGSRFSAFLILLTLIVSCGTVVEDAQSFKPNQAPEIGAMTGSRYDGAATETANILNDTTYVITVDAVDPEGQPITYDFTSEYGSFNDLQTTATGCSILFVTGGVKGNTPVTIMMTATDTKKGVSEKTFTLGNGKPPPSLVVTPTTLCVSDTGSPTPITVWADCDGEFQIFCNNAITDPADAHIDITQPATVFRLNSPARTVNICGKKLITVPPGEKFFRLPDGSGKDTVWVVFADLLGQEKAVPVQVTITF
ncbi:MAG TPA: hypothetical protein VF857_10660 [Spirochaetota bacterium]